MAEFAPSMEKLALSVKEKYRERLINREKLFINRHSEKLIRLELVQKEGSSTNLQRGREDKTVKRTTLAYSDLFKAKSGKKPVRKVLVEGDAGIGKTTLSISLSEDWASGKLFKEFELLFLLSFRHKEVSSAGSLCELLKLFHPDPDVCKAVDSYIRKKEAKKVLVIADGWDELSESEQNKESFLYKFLFKMFPFMSVVVTSRPSASAPLHNLACIDRLVEVNGFSKDDIKEYIQSEFDSDQEKARRLLEQLEYNPLIESVCSVPLNCAIICHLWCTLEEALPFTMTQLYTKLLVYVVCRNLRKLEAYGPTFGMSSFDDLPESLQQSWQLLCQFAYYALAKNKIIFSKKELLEFLPQGLAFDEKIHCFGMLHSAEIVLDVTCVVSFNFVHLTFMEYLAALYLSRQPLEKCLEFLQKDYFSMVSRFFFGICFSGSTSVRKDLDVKEAIQCVAADKYYKNRLLLCHCAFEAQNVSINNEVIHVLFNKPFMYHFGHPRTAHDCAAVLYVIDNMQECSGLYINFSETGVSENQIKTLTDALASKCGKLQVELLDLRGNKLTDKSVSDLFQRASAAFQSLLYLGLSLIETDSIKSITTALPMSSSSRCRLLNLFLSVNPLGVSGQQALEKTVSDDLLSNLKCLYLDGSLTNDADTNATFVEALSAHCPHLRELNLSQNNLGVPGATALARGISRQLHRSQSDGELNFGFMKQQQFLYDMYLNQTNLGDIGLCAFIENVDGVCHLRSLALNDNGIHATGVSCLVDAVCSGKIVFKGFASNLDLSDNQLGLDVTVAIGRMLSSNHCDLLQVCLFCCELTTAGGGLPNTDSMNLGNSISGEAVRDVGHQLCQMPQSDTIISLDLDGNSFTGEGIHILAGFMHLCTRLFIFYSQNCGITSDDLKQLFDELTQFKSSSPSLCSKLETWYLGDNEIKDSGVSALMSHLPSLFPRLYSVGDTHLSNNPVSSEMVKILEEELRRRKKFQPPESSSDGHCRGEEESLSETVRPQPLTSSRFVHQENDDNRWSIDGHSSGEEEPLSETDDDNRWSVSSIDGHSSEEADPLSEPHPPPRPHPLTSSQFVHQEMAPVTPGNKTSLPPAPVCIPLCTSEDLDEEDSDCSLTDPDSIDKQKDVYSGWVPKNIIWRGRKELRIRFLNIIPDEWTLNGNEVNTENIMSWANEWSPHGNGVIPTFTHIEEPSAPSDIRVKFTSNGRTESKIGNRAAAVKNEEATMWLDLRGKSRHHMKHLVVHEFGHALGLRHEHQRSDFWKSIKPFVDVDNMKRELIKQGVSDTKFYRNWVRDKEPEKGTCTPYDPKSIMHYGFEKEWLTHGYSDRRNVVEDRSLSVEVRAALLGVHERDDCVASVPSDMDIQLLKDLYGDKSLEDGGSLPQASQVSAPASIQRMIDETLSRAFRTMSEYVKPEEVPRTSHGDPPTNQPLCGATPQECGTAASVGETLTTVMDSGSMMEKERACDQSHDSSESENDEFFTPSTSPVPPQHDDRELLDVSCGAKCLTSLPEPPRHKMVAPSLEIRNETL